MKPFHLPNLMKQHKHFLLLTEPVSLTLVNEDSEEVAQIPRHAGLYGFVSREARDKAKARLNRANSDMNEIAFAVEPVIGT